MMRSRSAFLTLWFLLFFASGARAQRVVPPYDLWTDQVMTQVRDKSTLDYSIEPQYGFSEVYFTSNPSASFFDAGDPYAEHNGEKIRIHGYILSPGTGGPYPAVVIGHEHGGKADLGFAQLLANLGVVALAIDGPGAGKSTGGPADEMQAWISVDKGAHYSYLYHYAYAGMRALTLLEALADQPENPFRIDATKLGAFGVSMGGMFTTYLNGVDSRLKAAIAVSSAGNLQHTLRVPNSWLYHDIYTGTRDRPYNGSDPPNSIENIDTDPTAIDFLNYFDPIRYAPKQYAPVLTLIGTHDQYFPLPNANLMGLTISPAGSPEIFATRIWLVPNAANGYLNNSANLISLRDGLGQWLDYCFGRRGSPLASPQIILTETDNGLSFEIFLNDTAGRISGAAAKLYAATRVDSTSATITDFTAYQAVWDTNRFVASMPAGEKSASGDVYSTQNIVFYATVTDSLGLPVSSLVYKGLLPMDLSTDFVPVIEHNPADQINVVAPPAPADAARTISSATPVAADGSYQGVALTNPTDIPMSVRVEVRRPDGRMAAAPALINPTFMMIPPRAQRVFLAEEWLGAGARVMNGSLQIGWNDMRGSSLAFRGNSVPPHLDGIGPLQAPGTALWLPLVPEQDPTYVRILKLFSGSAGEAAVTLRFRTRLGEEAAKEEVIVPAWGRADLALTVGSGGAQFAVAQIESTAPVSARIEVRPNHDFWSIDALPASTSGRYVQPHAEFNGTFKTRLVIVNTSATAGRRIVRFRRHRQTGEVIGSEMSLFLENSQAAAIPLETLFIISSAEAPGAGWVEANVDGGGVNIYALAFDPDRRATAASPVGFAGAGTLSMPYFVENSGYWTGLAIANSGSVQASATIVAYGENGGLLGQSSITLGPGQSRTQLVHQWISGLPGEATGQIVVQGSSALSLLAYFGTNDGASMAAVPFTPATP